MNWLIKFLYNELIKLMEEGDNESKCNLKLNTLNIDLINGW